MFFCICEGKASICDCFVTVDCNCKKDFKKILVIEKNFLYDQWTTRNSYIGNLDRKETERLKQRGDRKQSTHSKKKKLTDLANCSVSNDRFNTNRSSIE